MFSDVEFDQASLNPLENDKAKCRKCLRDSEETPAPEGFRGNSSTAKPPERVDIYPRHLEEFFLLNVSLIRWASWDDLISPYPNLLHLLFKSYALYLLVSKGSCNGKDVTSVCMYYSLKWYQKSSREILRLNSLEINISLQQ